MKRQLAAIALAASLAASLAGCGSSIAGTYYGSAGDTALRINKDGTCAYTERLHDDKDNLEEELARDKDCT